MSIEDRLNFFENAEKEFLAGNYQKALEFYIMESKKGKRINDAHFRIGEIYLNEGRPYEAICEFDRVISKDENFFSAYFMKGEGLRAIGDYEQAISSFREIINRRNYDEFSYSKIAQCQIEMQNFDDAITTLKNINIKDTQNPDVEYHALLSKAFIAKGYYKKARKILEEGIHVDDENPDIYYNMFLVELDDENVTDAINNAKLALFYGVRGKKQKNIEYDMMKEDILREMNFKGYHNFGHIFDENIYLHNTYLSRVN